MQHSVELTSITAKAKRRPRRIARPIAAIALTIGLFGCSRVVNQNAPDSLATPDTSRVSPTTTPRAATDKKPVMRFPTRYEAELKKSINASLNSWRASIEERDAERHLQHYGDQIETYYNASNVNQAFVLDDRRRAFERYETLKVQLINIDIYLESKDLATIVFDKTWDFKRAAGGFSNGLVQQEIKMRKTENRWLIFSERDLEVYRVRNQ